MTTTKHTFCRICEAACPLLADIDDDGVVIKLRPDASHPVTAGYACHKGLSFLQVHNDPDRLDTPQQRTHADRLAPGNFIDVSWDAALNDIGTKLRAIQAEYGANAVAVYLGNPVGFNSLALPLAAKFAKVIGSQYSFSANTQDLANKYAASQHVFGSSVFMIPDLAATDFFICFGANPKISRGCVLSLPRPMDAIKAVKQRGGRTLFVNPRKIESAADDADVLQIKPDTDVYLMAALLHELFSRHQCDRTFTEQFCKHVPELRAFVARYPAQRVATVIGITATEIRQLADAIAAARSVAFYMGTGVNQGRQGTLAYWLLNMLTVVTGNFGAAGGSYKPVGHLPATQPTRPDAPVMTPLGLLQPIWGDLPGNLFADLIEHESRPIRALINIGGNPLLTMSGEDRLRAAFAKLECIVSIDIYRCDTCEMSDYVLPATDWLERADINFLALGLQLRPYVQYSDAMAKPAPERRNDWWILARIAQAMGHRSPLDKGDDGGWGFIEKALAANQMTLDELRNDPAQYRILPDSDDKTSSFQRVVLHEDGKIDCCPAAFTEALVRCENILQQLCEDDESRMLQLISLRTNYMHNSWFANVAQVRQGRHMLNPLHMHPDDAGERGLADNQAVVVSNRNGRIETQLRFNPDLRRGVVAMTHGYGHRFAPGLTLAATIPGANPNRLLPTGSGSYDVLSGMSWMNGVAVEVKALA